jgi:type I restriction enzyme S subunit
MGHIQRHHLSQAKMAVPPEAVLQRADAVLGPLTEAIWRRRVESRTLAGLRDSFLPKLITGKLRVRDAERFIQRVL